MTEIERELDHQALAQAERDDGLAARSLLGQLIGLVENGFMAPEVFREELARIKAEAAEIGAR
jgi:hypothetical protein